ncbi:hypothetical protein NL676_031752 [Syzygium grande]|nr:hypothetical protein NL676_031752 [Syzygium grande]
MLSWQRSIIRCDSEFNTNKRKRGGGIKQRRKPHSAKRPKLGDAATKKQRPGNPQKDPGFNRVKSPAPPPRRRHARASPTGHFAPLHFTSLRRVWSSLLPPLSLSLSLSIAELELEHEVIGRSRFVLHLRSLTTGSEASVCRLCRRGCLSARGGNSRASMAALPQDPPLFRDLGHVLQVGCLPSNFFYLRKPGSLRQPISFEDSPEWEDTDVDVRVEDGGDSIHVATTPASPSLSKLNSGSLPSPRLPEGAVGTRKIAGASVVWRDLTVTIKGKRKYSDKVVKNSSGYALPGTMTVIMGPAKSGKSTLLRAIAGRLPDSARMYGEVFVNGTKSHMPYGSYGFVERGKPL